MAEGALARRYAKAFVQITAKKGIVDLVGVDLLALADVLAESKELQVLLANPAISPTERLKVLEELLRRLGAQPEARVLIQLLIDRGRITALGAIARAYRAIADELAGRVRAAVHTAERLDETRMKRIQSALEASTGKKVLLQQREDPSLVAGVVTQIGSWVYDGSLRTQLRQLRESLLAGQ